MFNNIGRKIKNLAQFFCLFGIIASIVSGLVLMSQGNFLIAIGLLVAVVGSLLAWVGSFLLYGFGEMVENSDIRTELAVKEAMAKSGEQE